MKNNLYSEGAAKYHDKIMKAGYRDYAPFIKFMKKILTKSDVVLELGAGTGSVVSSLKSSCTIEAVENSPIMVATLKKNEPKLQVYTNGISAIHGESRYTIIFSHSGPFSLKEEDDKLFFETYLESKDQLIECFKHIHRLLKVSGQLIINKEISRPERYLKLDENADYFSTTIEDGSRILRTHVVMDKGGRVLAKQTFTKTMIPYDHLKEKIAEIGFSADLDMMSVVAFKKIE